MVFYFVVANENRRVVDIICGALAGCTAMTCAMPLDVIRTRLVAQSEQKVRFLAALNTFFLLDGSHFLCVAKIKGVLRDAARCACDMEL